MTGLAAGKVALVTGGASGIGRAAAEIFAREGARVVVADINASGAEETVSRIAGRGGEAIFVGCDTSDPEQIDALVDATVAAWERLDCAFNNAGVGHDTATLVNTSEEDFDYVYRINMRGVWLCSDAASFVTGHAMPIDGGITAV